MNKISQKKSKVATIQLVKPTKSQILMQRYHKGTPKGKSGGVVAASKLIGAAYIISENKRMSPQETVQAVKGLFDIMINVKQVYQYRYDQRKANKMTPYDRTAKFFPKGYTQVKKTV